MIHFEEERAKCKPSPEIDEAEDLIMADNMTDMTDLMVQLLKEIKEKD